MLPHHAAARDWADAVAALWSGAPRYMELSRAALDHSRRSDLDPEQQVAKLMDILHRTVGPEFA